MEDKLARAEVIDVSKLSSDTIKFGATVTLTAEDTGENKVRRVEWFERKPPRTLLKADSSNVK